MGHPPGGFTVRIDRRNGVARLALRGELDLATVPILEEQLSLAESDGIDAIVLDLRDLRFVDSVGLRAFIRASKRGAANGHRFAIVGVGEPVRGLFRLTELERLLNEPEGLRLMAVFTQGSSTQDRLVEGAGRADG